MRPWAAMFSVAPLGETRCVDPNVGLISGLLRCPRGLEQTSCRGCQEDTALKMSPARQGVLLGEGAEPPTPLGWSLCVTMGSIQP